MQKSILFHFPNKNPSIHKHYQARENWNKNFVEKVEDWVLHLHITQQKSLNIPLIISNFPNHLDPLPPNGRSFFLAPSRYPQPCGALFSTPFLYFSSPHSLEHLKFSSSYVWLATMFYHLVMSWRLLYPL